jgi:hypothetical protein
LLFLHLDNFEISRTRCPLLTKSTKNTISSSQEVRNFPSTCNPLFLLHFILIERTPDRRYCRLRHRWPACSSRPTLAYSCTRSGPSNIQRLCSHVACALPISRSAWLAYGPRAHQQPECGAGRPLGNRAVWPMSRWWREYQRYVSVCLEGIVTN